MHVFFWEKNSYGFAKVSSQHGNAIEVILSSGDKKRINKNKTLFVFVNQNIENFVEKAEREFKKLDVKDVWKLAPKNDFTVDELSENYSLEGQTLVGKAALLMCLIKNPIYFRKKQSGFFGSASPDIINLAIKSEKLKEENLKVENALIDKVMAGELPKRIKDKGDKILFETDKQCIEYKAIKKAGINLGLRPIEVLYNIGFFKSAFEYHKLAFFHKIEQNLYNKIPVLVGKEGSNLFDGFDFPIAKVEAYSIDDIYTTEIDDAFSLQHIDKNFIKWKLGIHIALPTKFLTPFDCFTAGISDQALSIYSPSEKKTMLPKSILKYASLDENTFRPVLSLYIDFDEKGSVLSDKTVLEKIFIKQNIRFGDWENEFEKDPLTAELPWSGLIDLNTLAKILSSKRNIKNKNKHKTKPEFKVTVSERENKEMGNLDMQGVPLVELRKRGSLADTVVSEFMILANSIWGEMLKNLFKPAIFRVNSSGFTRMQTTPSPHEDLGVEVYAWMTSPLRRYVDFINQWQLVCSIIPGKDVSIIDKKSISVEIKNYEKKQFLYNNFQKLMEKYWIYRWLTLKKNKSTEFWEKTEENRIFLYATYLGKGQLCLVDIPLTFRFQDFTDLTIGKKIRVELESIDCLDMKVKLCRA